MSQLWIHVPTPGDHYSPATGSARITVIREISRAHAARGGCTRVIVGRGTRHDYERDSEGDECVEVPFSLAPSRAQKAVDAALGRAGIPRFFGPRQYLPLLQAVESEFAGPLFIHCNPTSLRAIRKARPRARICFWANNEVWRPYGNSEARRVADATDRLICCSKFIADALRSRIGDHPAIRVVYNGVNTDVFRPAAAPLEEDEPTILFVGRVLPEKGPHLLLKAAANLRDSHRFRVRLVGSRGFNPNAPLAPYERELRDLAAPLGERVEFVPSVNRKQVVEEYQRASIFCAPALWNEPFGLTTLESMACGLPTVVTKRGATPEVGGDAALYFDPEKETELSDLLAHLIENSAARREAGKQARLRAQTFAWENQYRQLVAALA